MGKVKRFILLFFKIKTLILFKLYRINYKSFVVKGPFSIHVQKKGKCTFGDHFTANAGVFSIDNGVNTKIMVYDNASLYIGDNVGISTTCIVCRKEIKIGNYTKIGAGCMITDSNHHSLDYIKRQSDDFHDAKCAPVNIGSNVFIGMRSIILKGVNIGDKSIVAAGSVVSRDIPKDEIWGGNPAIFIKKTGCIHRPSVQGLPDTPKIDL